MSAAPVSFVAATRRSALALAQTRAFLRDFGAAQPHVSLSELLVVTSGDRIQDRPLSEVGGKGLFVKEIEEALLDGRAHLAVHSMKDLPAQLPESLVIGCVPPRADPRDVLLLRPGLLEAESCAALQRALDGTLAPERGTMDIKRAFDAALPDLARVGSSSLRRRCSLLAVRPDLQIEPLRGNVDTRLRRLAAGDFDAIILAAAGLARLGLGRASLPSHLSLPARHWLPAVAQGLLAIEIPAGHSELGGLLSVLEDRDSRLQAEAERGVLEALGADCTVPLAAHARVEGEMLWLSAKLWRHDGQAAEAQVEARCLDASAANALGREVGRRLSSAL